MATDYIEITVHLSRPGDFIQDLLIAGLGEAGYESFLETETGFNAYIRQDAFSEKALQDAIQEIADETTPRAALETASTNGEQDAPGVSYKIRSAERRVGKGCVRPSRL